MGIQYIIPFAAVVERSKGETLEYALLNTIIGISVVFVVLIVISIIISLFNYIAKIEARMKEKDQKEVVAIQPSTEESAIEESEDLSDDFELVAVITAAIEAYEESCGNLIPNNGLYVKSIRKINKKKWQNA